jgi:hypothetical protein
MLRVLSTALACALFAGALHAQFPKLTPLAHSLDTLVVDTTLDGVWRLMDLNQDGDCNDAGEVTTFYDDVQGSIVLTNPACIAVGPDAIVYIADSTFDIVVALRDANGDGDALDAGEHWVFFDSATNASGIAMATVQGLTVDADGVVLVATASSSSFGDDAVLRLVDTSLDGDANDLNEASSYGIVQAFGAGALGDSIPTKVRVGQRGDLYFTEVGSTGVIAKGVYAMRDIVVPNGHCNDPGEIVPYWIPSLGGNPFFWALEATSDGVLYITDHGSERIWRAQDLNSDGSIQAGTAEETLYYQNPGASTMWEVLVREDGAIVVCEDETPDRLLIYQDLDQSGTIDQPNEISALYDASVAVHATVRPRGAAFLPRPTLEASPNPVRLGQNIGLEFLGTPLSTAALFAAPGSIPRFPLPPFGDLELAPIGLSFVGTAALDIRGTSLLFLFIPIDPTLVGTIPLQSFELSPFRPHLSRRLDVQIRP